MILREVKTLLAIFFGIFVFNVNNCEARASKYNNRPDPDRIMFPDSEEDSNYKRRDRIFPVPPKTETNVYPDSTAGLHETGDRYSQLPLQFAMKLNQVSNVSDLLLHYVDTDDVFEESLLANRFGDVERKAAVSPKHAACIPSPEVVELKNVSDPNLIYIPSCTRVDRCGGCCSHNLLSCQPSQTELISYQVFVTQYSGGEKLKFKGKEIVVVEKHTKCKCDCKIKETDCNEYQEYRKNECRCVCLNLDDRRKCDKSNQTMLWDTASCKCVCRETKDCSTGLYFDQSKCVCTPIPVRRRFAELGSSRSRDFEDRESYDVSSGGKSPKTEK